MAKAVFCIARSEAQASNIIERLKRANFSASDVSMLFPDKSGTKDFAHEQHSKLPEGAAAGGVAAGVVGGAVGWLAGVGALAIPGLGPLIAGEREYSDLGSHPRRQRARVRGANF